MTKFSFRTLEVSVYCSTMIPSPVQCSKPYHTGTLYNTEPSKIHVAVWPVSQADDYTYSLVNDLIKINMDFLFGVSLL